MPQKNLEHEGTMLNITAQIEHVPEMERYICTIKERIWAIPTPTNRRNHI